MNVTAVICEMNPLHLGHDYILREIRKTSDCVIAVMSGNFVQRADCALMDKYARAEAVIQAGADLVVEMPFPFCSAGAEYFASAGVSIAHSLGADTLAFGVTEDRGDLYERIADVILSPDFANDLQEELRKSPESGIAQLRQKCLQKYFAEDLSAALNAPNDILAIEYVKSIRRAGYAMQTCPILRLNSQADSRFVGATGIREMLVRGMNVQTNLPAYSYEILKRETDAGRIASPAKLQEQIFYHLRRRKTGSAFAEGGGGVQDRLVHCADDACSGEELFTLAATKKYTNARLRRAALFDLLSVTESELKQTPAYTMLLAANKTGCAYLSSQRKDLSIPILTKPSDERDLPDAARIQYGKAKEADRLYTLCQNKVLPADDFLRRTPYIKQK